MDITDELIRIEISKVLCERIGECMNKIIEDFNEEDNGIELDEIKMENVHYVVSVKDRKITL